MQNSNNLNDNDFESKFSDCSLNPALFNHEAHIRLAWIHINKYGIDQAINNVCTQIKLFDVTHGDGAKFHKTLTVASVRTVYHFFLKSQSNNFTDFIQEFPRLNNSFKGLIDAHYGINLFNSEKAKIEFIEPDLLPYD